MSNSTPPSAFDICYAVSKSLKLTLIDIMGENNSWYRFQDADNKITLVKSVKTDASTIGFKDFDSLCLDVNKLIIIFKKNNQYCKCEILINDIDKEKLKKSFQEKTILRDSNKTNSEISIEKIDDLSSAVSRYKSITERNYNNNLNYLLFEFYCTTEGIHSWTDKDKKMSKREYKTSFYAYLKTENIFVLIEEYLCKKSKSINYTLGIDTKKAYKDLYKDMTRIRNRNVFFNIVKEHEDIAKCIESYKEKYYVHYQSNILTFENFNKFWNADGSRSCHYCGVNEKQIVILDKNDQIETKRFYSRGSTMEIDKIDADDEYKECNIILSCYWCNNAKTDEYTLHEFEPIAKGIKTVWNERLKNIDSTEKVTFPEETYSSKKDCK